MKIRILGTRAKIEGKSTGHIKHTGILIDDKILFDLGEKEYLKLNPECIFISHLHPDHAYFENSGEEIKTDTAVYGPEKSLKLEKIKIIGEGDEIEINDYKITALPVIHSIKVKSLGYIIERKGKRIFFSGDVAWIEKKYHKYFGKLDLLITEGSYIRKGGMIRRDKNSGQIFGHTGIPDLVEMFRPYCNHIVFLHLGSWFMKDPEQGRKKIEQSGNQFLKVEAAFDGQVFNL